MVWIGLQAVQGRQSPLKIHQQDQIRSKAAKKDICGTGDSLPVFNLFFQELYFNYSESRETSVAYTKITFHIYVQQNMHKKILQCIKLRKPLFRMSRLLCYQNSI